MASDDVSLTPAADYRALQALFAHALDAIFFLNDAAGFVDANPAACRLLGYTHDHLVGLRTWDVIPPASEDSARRHWAKMLQLGTLAGEYQLLHRDATRRDVECRAVANVLPGLHLAVMRDVTDRKVGAEVLRHQAQIVDQIQEAIIAVDLDLHVTSWNNAAERLFGHLAAEALGRHISIVYPPGSEEVVASLESEVTATGQFAGDIRLRRKSGDDFFGHVALSLLKNDAGDVDGIVGYIVDVTDRKSAQEQLRKSHAQLRRVAAQARSRREEERRRVSRELHDQLGQALAGLKIDLCWLADRVAGVEQTPVDVTEKLGSMLGLVDDTIKRVRRIASELRPGVLDKLGLVAAIEWQAEDFERRCGIRCRTDLRTEHIDLDRGRSTEVFRIFEAALINVVMHAHATSVKVMMLSEANGWLRLAVADNGCGIDDAAIASDDSLGLIGMRERAALLGGSVDVRRGALVGTIVTVRIPLTNRRKAPR